MIYQELEKIVQQERLRKTHLSYIQILLKEYLQVYVLYFIYTSKKYGKNLIFTGGTCLRHFYNLERLSEDVDFDYLREFESKELLEDLKDFFIKIQKYKEIQISLKQKGEQILLKFPVLYQLGLAQAGQSNLLHVKVDLSKNSSKHYSIITTSKSKYGFNFVAKHYDLPDLMAGKIHAILKRRRLRGKEERASVKGRDYFDLLWFVKKGVKPNIKRLSDLLGRTVELKDIERELDQKVEQVSTKLKTDFQADLIPFVVNPAIVPAYVHNYKEEYLRYKSNSFSNMVALMLKCKECGKNFSSGIAISEESFKTTEFKNNTHVCPFCGFKNVVNKGDYGLAVVNTDLDVKRGNS